MLNIVASSQVSNKRAAIDLAELIKVAWPDVETDPHCNIHIVPGAKTHKQQRQDIDLLVLVNFSHAPAPVRTSPERTYVRSLLLVIEIKEHPPERIRFEGNKVEVEYRGSWEDASEQSHEQANSVRNYIKEHAGSSPYVTNLLWLRNIREQILPSVSHNVLGSDATWEQFVLRGKTISSVEMEPFGETYRVIDAKGGSQAWRCSFDSFCRPKEGTKLDRNRIERICESILRDQLYAEKIGTQLLIFRGRGGTGKTVRLLRIARDLYMREDARILLLTYNRALMADLKRLMFIMRIRTDSGGERIHIQGVHSFMYHVLTKQDIYDPRYGNYLQRYDAYLDKFLEYVDGGAITKDDLETMVQKDVGKFGWDYILIDEAQDWPAQERDILYFMYDFRRFVLADGVDQLVRSHQAVDWRAPISRADTQVIPLRQVLRLKRNLCLFLDSFTEHLEMDHSDFEPNQDTFGGRIVVVHGDTSNARSFLESLLAQNQADGNAPVDMLVCVPPERSAGENSVGVTPGNMTALCAEWGIGIWDGTDTEVRDEFPQYDEQLRVVQYDSSRGLEGWIVVNWGLDQFYDYKVNSYTPLPEEIDLFFDHNRSAHLYALRWLLIPLTRAIDTLVIHMTNSNHRLANVLQEVAAENPDFVEWHEL